MFNRHSTSDMWLSFDMQNWAEILSVSDNSPEHTQRTDRPRAAYEMADNETDRNQWSNRQAITKPDLTRKICHLYSLSSFHSALLIDIDIKVSIHLYGSTLYIRHSMEAVSSHHTHQSLFHFTDHSSFMHDDVAQLCAKKKSRHILAAFNYIFRV